MKFLQKHMAQIIGDRDSVLAKNVVPVSVTAIADWYFEESEIYEFDMRTQFPSVVAPFPVMFLEYRIPLKWKIYDEKKKEFVIIDAPHQEHDWFGMLIVQDKLPDNYTGDSPYEGDVLRDVYSAIHESGGIFPKFKQHTFLYVGDQESVKLACWFQNYVDQAGKMMGGPAFDLNPAMRHADTKDSDVYSTITRCYGYPVYFALSLMTCKNVQMRELGISGKDRRQAARDGTSPLGYREIVIDPMRKSIRSGEHGNGNSVMTAMRIAAGHWKDYTQGNGLFGRLHGRFWWDDYLKVQDEKVLSQIRSYRFKPVR
jgi:hypothetical protein